MKYLIISLFVCCSLSLYSQEKVNIGIIGFYNFENLYDTINQEHVDDQEFTPESSRRYTGEVYWDKLKHLDRVIALLGAEHNPDGAAILGVAEIENRSVLKDFCNQTGVKSRNYNIVHYDSRDARGIDVGLLYNPKYFKVLKSDKIFVDLSGLGEGNTRDILWVHGLFLGEEIHLMVAHWPSRRGGEEASMARRCKAAEAMRTKADSIFSKNPNANIVVMGDFNDDPTSPSIVKCLKVEGEKYNAIHTIFYNPFANYFKKGIGTLAFNDAWNLFDQILVSPSFLNRERSLYFEGAFIFHKNFMIQQDGRYRGYPLRTYSGDTYQAGYSDHFPTYIVLKKKIMKP